MKKKASYGRSRKYETYVGVKENPYKDELCPTKEEMRRINAYLRKMTPPYKKGVSYVWAKRAH